MNTIKEPMTEEQRAWIDNASYTELLGRWRYAPSGSSWFRGECGEYYETAMRAQRAAVGVDGHVAASKAVGWA